MDHAATPNPGVFVFSVPLAHTTAHYFARAIRVAGERSCTYMDSLFDPALLQKDDLLFFVDPAPAWPLGLEAARCVTAAYLIDVHQDLASRLALARFFDIVFVAQKDLVDDFRRAGHQNVHWLPLACDPALHAVHEGTRDVDVGFVGRLGPVGSRRHSILSSILPKFRTNDYHRYYLPDEMAAVYAASKIVLNVSVNNDVNMRVFEAMGAGALLLTDRVGNGLGDLFTEGIHYVGFSSAEEAVAKVQRLLRSHEERESIAEAGRQAVLSHHTYDARWSFVQQQADAATRNAEARRYDDRALRQLYGSIFVSLRQPWRLGQVWARYGVDRETIGLWLWAWGRWTNARVPVTPNAIRARMHAWSR